MMHLQGSVNNWTQAVERLPFGFNIKAVNRPDLLRDAWRIKKVGTTLRHWADDMQQFGGGWETQKNRARQYFNRFIDGTFRDQYAPYIDIIETFNEVWAASQSAQERQERIDQDRAFAVVWNQEYRTRPELAHIRVALMSAAVGNDLPRQSAVTAIENDCYLNYHPYVAVHWPDAERGAIITGNYRAAFRSSTRPYMVPLPVAEENSLLRVAPGQRSSGDWRWCSGRFHFMEQEWGLKPRWILSEAGPVRDYTGGLILDPQGGWRLIWGNEGRAQMVDMMRQWLVDVVQTPAFNEGRIAGFHQFTTGGGNTWKWFEVAQPELSMVAELTASMWTVQPPPPPPPPPPADWQQAAWNESIRRQTISLNPNAALQKAIFRDGFVPVESEFELDGRALQAAEHLQTGDRRVYYAVIPNWSDVRWFGEPGTEHGTFLAVDVSEHQGEIDVPKLQAKMRAAQS